MFKHTWHIKNTKNRKLLSQEFHLDIGVSKAYVAGFVVKRLQE
jgi:hypothetical protein